MAKSKKSTGANLGFEDKPAELSRELCEQMANAGQLDVAIRQKLEVLGYGE